MPEKDRLITQAVRLHPETIGLIKTAGVLYNTSPSEIHRKALGEYFTARALEDPHFAEIYRMAREGTWVSSIVKATDIAKNVYNSHITETSWEDVVNVSERLDLNPERTASLLGIEIPTPPLNQGE